MTENGYSSRHSVITFGTLSQEEELQEIVSKISSKCAECDEAQAQMADCKAAYEKAEQKYKQHKEQIFTAAEDAEHVKVILKTKIR